jgi:hypothetical protein
MGADQDTQSHIAIGVAQLANAASMFVLPKANLGLAFGVVTVKPIGGINFSNATKGITVNSVDSILKPNGQFAGTVNKGATPNIRTVSPNEFNTLKNNLLNGATASGTYDSGKGTWYDLPSGGRVGVRTSDNSGMTLDIDILGYPKGFKVHQQ